ncbi:NUDIX domain-containing protein [Sunxiuqinia rutila]|uniref:NUDIX domain-containing protein n=1 Tax=Sunxiuqinia rutila TaxID=1397841 RepID=UPI003D35A76A
MTQAQHPNKIFKFCPSCGSTQLRQSGDRSKKCPHCGFHYFFNTSAAVAAIIFDPEGKIMLARRAVDPHKGQLDFPGGFVDPMETAEEALTREIQEELGTSVKKMTYFASFPNTYPFAGMEVMTLDLAFLVELETLTGLKPMDDIASIEFYHPSEVNLDELPAQSMKNILKKLNEHT